MYPGGVPSGSFSKVHLSISPQVKFLLPNRISSVGFSVPSLLGVNGICSALKWLRRLKSPMKGVKKVMIARSLAQEQNSDMRIRNTVDLNLR